MEPLRKCTDCGLEAHSITDLVPFKNDKKSKFQKRNLCVSCSYKRSRQRALQFPEEAHQQKMKYQRAKRYGITSEEYAERMETSDKCECCGSKENLCYDHCHESMAFRGVLCRGCNAAIGGLGDTEEGVLKALTYLIKHRESQNEIN